MRLNRLFSVAMLSIIFGGTASAQQPYGGCWHPEHVKNWSPETDKNAKFNRSKVPLAKRFKEPTLMKANKNQFYEGQVCNATILFPIDSSPLKSASVISLFLSAPILYEEAETHNHISQSIGALLKHQLLSRGSFVTLLI